MENLQPLTNYERGLDYEPVITPRTVDDPDPDNPPWSVGTAVTVFLISIACLLFVPMIVVAPYLAYLATQGTVIDAAALGQNPTLIALSLLGTIPAHLVTLYVVWRVVTNRGQRPFAPYVGWDITAREVAACVGVALGLYGVAIMLSYFSNGAETPMDQMVKSSTLARYATAFLAIVTAPITEELVYRGVLFSALRQKYGRIIAIASVSVLFAAVHAQQYITNWFVIAVIFILSLTLTLVRNYTRRVRPSIVIHTIFNGVQAVLLVLGLDLEKTEKTATAIWRLFG